MDAKVISKDQIASLLDGLIGQYQVLAPVRRDGVVLFDEITSGSEAVLDVISTKMSAKEAFFPPVETLFTFDGTQAKEPPAIGDRVLFGLRPCDARSVHLLDPVFDDPDYVDVYYLRRRERTCLVAVGCNRPLGTCFCTSLRGEPFGQEGSDILFSDIGDQYLVQALTDKGRALLDGNPLLQEATDLDLGKKAQVAQEAKEQIKSSVETRGLKAKLDGMFQDPVWEIIAQTCLGCGVCTYVCPTCHCFDVVDETEGDRGQRVRIWDSCQYPLFTHHTSGHNPRPSGKARMRQRVMHKFHYFIENQGEIACVGCGRCVRNCPVNLDIRDILALIMDA